MVKVNSPQGQGSRKTGKCFNFLLAAASGLLTWQLDLTSHVSQCQLNLGAELGCPCSSQASWKGRTEPWGISTLHHIHADERLHFALHSSQKSFGTFLF